MYRMPGKTEAVCQQFALAGSTHEARRRVGPRLERWNVRTVAIAGVD